MEKEEQLLNTRLEFKSFIDYLRNERRFSENTIKSYQKDIAKFLIFLNDNSIDYEIYSFFQNFKSMLFNNEHDTTPTYIIEQSRDYIYSILGNSKRKSKMTDICKYAAFVESLTELGNAISASNMKL